MPRYLRLVVGTLRRAGTRRRHLLWENLPFRQQLALYQRHTHRPRLRQRDRVFWSLLARHWAGWRGHGVMLRARNSARERGAAVAPDRRRPAPAQTRQAGLRLALSPDSLIWVGRNEIPEVGDTICTQISCGRLYAYRPARRAKNTSSRRYIRVREQLRPA